MIVNIMKCQKSSIRDLYWLYLFSRGNHHFYNALAPECACTICQQHKNKTNILKCNTGIYFICRNNVLL